MKEGIDFYFGNYPSSTEDYLLSVDLGIVNATIEGGLFEEVFIPEREIRETKIRGNSKPYFHGFDYKPLRFDLTFAFIDTFHGTEVNSHHTKLRELAKWLRKPYYVPFGIVGEDRIFYVSAVDSSQLFHNGNAEGYVTVPLRCDAPWAYSKIKNITLNSIEGNGDLFEFVNNGDLDIFPEMWIEKINTEEFKVINENTGEEFKFDELFNEETVYIHNEKEYIETSRPLIHRYDGFNNKYLRIVPGINRLKFYGSANIKFKYQEKLITV